MTRLEHGMHTATVHTMRGRDGVSRIAWRSLLATIGGAVGVVLLAAPCYAQAAATGRAETSVGLPSAERGGATEHGNAIRPFRINVPEEALLDLRRRVVATRWPERETVTDQSQGVQLAKIQPLIQYWGTDYDWRKAEAKLNALPQFVTTIDGVDIQFVHVKSRHPNAMPLIMTHGWPGSIFELLKVVGPLTDPTAYGGRPEDAFDLVMPTLPGYGFSGKPQGSPWGPDRMGRAWDALMQRLGYTRYVSQGGDWGAI
ncbi:MAG TPA: epoxide hydrolase, partial [Steroidobacteraceae bacterium]|nr:epoxide hydrolase [Steroidobacteraceae bacterium]